MSFTHLSHPLPQGERVKKRTAPYGSIDTGEKSTNQLFGCTKPLTFGLMARGSDVVGDVEECGVVDRGRVQFSQRTASRADRIEGLPRLGHQFVELRDC